MIEKTDNQRPDQKNGGEKEKIEVLGTLGITLNRDGDRDFINIPINVVSAVGGRDVITRQLHPQAFDKSFPAWSEQSDDSYKIEIYGSSEQVQNFIKIIEDAYRKASG